MKINNRVTLVFLLIVISGSSAIAQTNLTTSPENKLTSEQIEEFKKLQRDREIRQQVQKEIDTFNQTLTNTVEIINNYLSIINLLLLVIPTFVTILFWIFRQSVIDGVVSQTKKELEEELKEKLKEKQEQVRSALENNIDISQQEIQKQIDEKMMKAFKDMDKNFDAIKEELKNKLETTFEEVKQRFQEETDKIENSILQDVLSDAQSKKAEILNNLSRQVPSLETIPDTNQPDIQQNIQQLLTELEALRDENREIYFTTEDYLKQGNAFFFTERYKDAISSYDKVLEKEPDNYFACVNRGWALRRLGIYEEALSSYENAIEIQPGHHIGWYGKGNALSELQRYDLAIQAYNKCLIIKSDFAWAWYRKARCYVLKNDINSALENLEKAITLNPEKFTAIAINDRYLEGVRKDKRFRKIIGN